MRMEMRFRWWIGLIVVVLAGSAHAEDYWVSNDGDDGDDGLSEQTAWETLLHAADEVGPGDTVHVLDGDYQGFYLETSGTSGQPITFVAEGDDVRITEDNPTTPDGINLEGASWVVIDGFVVDGRTRTGVRAVLADHVTVRNCRLGFNGRWGILTGFVDDFLAEGNEAHHSQIEHGIYVSNSADRPTVRNNVVYSNAGNGLHFNGDASLGGDGLIEEALVEGNVIYDNGEEGGSAINMDGGVNGVIRNNLIYDNHASGISLYRIDAGAGASGNLVINNTIVQPSDGRWAVNIMGGSTGNVVRNNILYNYHSFRGAISIDASSRPGFVEDHNAVLGRFSTNGGSSTITLSAWQGLGYGVDTFATTPDDLFVDTGTDFHLLSDAPAVNAGSSVGAPSVDIEGRPRPAGAEVDIGAYELGSDSCGNGVTEPPLEECELDAECGGDQQCESCQCVAPPICASGIGIAEARLTFRPSSFVLRAQGEVVIPEPWSSIDPPANGFRMVVDESDGENAWDVTVPGGAAWTVSANGKRWTYIDPLGSAGGVIRAVIDDRSDQVPGELRIRVRARGSSAVLPSASDVRWSVVLGDADECAVLDWNPPGGPSPRCQNRGTRTACR
jgi:parallel beta-helix repeat protein